MKTNPSSSRPKRLASHLATALLFAITVPALHAATPANDVASNNPPYVNPTLAGSLQTGQNGGFGFAPFILNLTNDGMNGGTGYSGTFIDDSRRNGPGVGGSTSDINTGGLAFGLYAGDGGTIEAIRPLTGGALAIGQSISLNLDNGYIQNGGSAGFGFRDSSGVNRLEFFFVGGQNNYTVSGSTNTATARGFTFDGLNATFTLTGADTYTLVVNFNATANSTPASSETFSGTLGGTPGGLINDVRVFNLNAQNDVYFNSLTVSPQASATATFRITAVQMLSANTQIQLSVEGLTIGRTYRVADSTTLASFTDIAGSDFVADAATRIITLAVAPGTDPKRFFRVRDIP